MATSNAITFRMGVGYGGATNRNHDATVVREVLAPTGQPTAYGVMLTGDPATGMVRAPIASDTAALFVGFFVRPFPTQGGGLSNPTNDPLGVSTPPGPANEANVLKRGFMTVQLNAASTAVVKWQPVGIFIGTPTAGNLAGGVTGAAAGATVLAVPNCFFMGPADATGMTEISYNL
jgi:hypothetical protein